jgi:hypothetical protein
MRRQFPTKRNRHPHRGRRLPLAPHSGSQAVDEPRDSGRIKRAASPLVGPPELTRRTSSRSFPSPFRLFRLSRFFKRVIPRLFYLRVVNIYAVIIGLLFLCTRELRTGIFINHIYRWGWFLSGTHSCKEDSWEARTVTRMRQFIGTKPPREITLLELATPMAPIRTKSLGRQ